MQEQVCHDVALFGTGYAGEGLVVLDYEVINSCMESYGTISIF